MFFKHFGNKNQLPGLSIIGTLVENWLRNTLKSNFVSLLQDVRGEAEMRIYDKLNLKMDEFLGLGIVFILSSSNEERNYDFCKVDRCLVGLTLPI